MSEAGMVSHKALMRKLILICIAMFAFGYALVPLYDVFCEITGINGKTSNRAANFAQKIDESRDITVEFLANRDTAMPWLFEPEIAKIDIHPGKVVVVNFMVENPTEEAMIGRAVPSVSPGEAAKYFKKIECFCFSEQPLDAHERRAMPVQFYVDPELPTQFTTITLSYRLYKSTPQLVGR
jgi:cytochrome c oxidase assembly protein subunit 11